MQSIKRLHFQQKQKNKPSKNGIYQKTTKEKGNWGERVAAWFLTKNGYYINARNVLYRSGEIDIVATKEGVLLFIEVKTRAHEGFGTVESITPQKQIRLKRAAQKFVADQGLVGAKVQFDCVVVLGTNESSNVRVRHYKNCF